MRIAAIAGLAILALAGNAMAQDWEPWKRFRSVDGVNIEYRVKRDGDGFRVAWRCINVNSQAVACSVGAGRNKRYSCYSGTTKVGETGALGERSTVRGSGTYEFMSEDACRGVGATYVQPFAEISIERN